MSLRLMHFRVFVCPEPFYTGTVYKTCFNLFPSPLFFSLSFSMSDKCKLNTGQWIFHWQRFSLRSNRCRYSKFSTIFDGLLENRKEIFLSL